MGTRQNRLAKAVLTSTHNPTIYVLSRNMKNIRIFYLKIFIFLVVKFSIYLYRCVFVMLCFYSGPCGSTRGFLYLCLSVPYAFATSLFNYSDIILFTCLFVIFTDCVRGPLSKSYNYIVTFNNF